MIVDTSALAAILLRESDADDHANTLAAATGTIAIPASVVLELGILADNPEKDFTHAELDRILSALLIEIVPVTPELAAAARAAHTRYGRFSGSKAKLNFGDCFSYALAKQRNEPLLFKGDDFTHTDVIAA